eukprot:683839-Rhodomonas_salina.1
MPSDDDVSEKEAVTKFLDKLQKEGSDMDMIRGFETIDQKQYLLHFDRDIPRATLMCLSTLQLFMLQTEVLTTHKLAAPSWAGFIRCFMESKHVRIETDFISVCMSDIILAGTGGGMDSVIQYNAFCRLCPVGADTN